MKKGQLVTIKKEIVLPDIFGCAADIFVIIKGPYEGIFAEGKHSRLAAVVDLLDSSGKIVEKVECIYLERA